MINLKGSVELTENVTGKLTDSDLEIIANIEGTGSQGLSAYEVWLNQGNNGDEQDFLDSLVTQASDYKLIGNKPSIEGVELIDNKDFKQLGIYDIKEDEITNIF